MPDAEQETRPNIILIMTDQQRFDTIAALGLRPHDHAQHGPPGPRRRLVHQAFCPGATCISSRAAMFTGM